MTSDFASAEDAFAVLASRLRLTILETLDDAAGEPYTFTELYEAVDAANTSQFSYHLDKLAGRYVTRTDDGYVLRDAGLRILQSINAGEYTVHPEFEPFSVSTRCPTCDGTVADATYDGRLATVDCRSCERTLVRYDLRPAHVEDRTPREALEAADRQMGAEYSSALSGVCQRCGGSVDQDLVTGETAAPADAILACECRHCGTALSAPVEIALVRHPTAIDRYWREGIDTHTTPIWELFPQVLDWPVEIEDAATVVVSVPGAGDVCIDAAAESTVRIRNPIGTRAD